jgi:uncharacterized glyoxalase superfamily protein PhnB
VDTQAASTCFSQWVKDVDAYHREIVRRGAVVAMEPTDQPYGIREFVRRDVNGVAIVFGQDIDHGEDGAMHDSPPKG